MYVSGLTKQIEYNSAAGKEHNCPTSASYRCIDTLGYDGISRYSHSLKKNVSDATCEVVARHTIDVTPSETTQGASRALQSFFLL